MKALEEANQGKLLSKADQENEQKLALELQQMHLNTDRYRQQVSFTHTHQSSAMRSHESASM